jgi:hypothetical protein
MPCCNASLAMMYDALRVPGAGCAAEIPTGTKHFWDVNIFCSSSSVLPLQDLHLENGAKDFTMACVQPFSWVIPGWE